MEGQLTFQQLKTDGQSQRKGKRLENTDEAGVEAQLAECLASFQEGLGFISSTA